MCHKLQVSYNLRGWVKLEKQVPGYTLSVFFYVFISTLFRNRKPESECLLYDMIVDMWTLFGTSTLILILTVENIV